MEEYMEREVGDFQEGFRKGMGSTTDQIFMLEQILIECYERNTTINMLSVQNSQQTY